MIYKKFLKNIIPPILLPTNIKGLFKNKEGNVFDYDDVPYDRLSLIHLALSLYKNCRYLEIGVSDGNLYNSIPLPLDRKHGVDPEKGGQHRMTSDVFFNTNKKFFDVIFLDGLHTYEQLKKDFDNSLNFINENGIIFIHDLIPQNKLEEGLIQPKDQGHWKGDVWKLGVELNFSKNIEFAIANIDQGVGIVKIKKNFHYKKINGIEKKGFEDFVKYYENLNIISAHEAFEFIKKKN
jgi:hypothetical protein